MNKEHKEDRKKLYWYVFFLELFVGLVLVGGIFALFQSTPTIEIPEKIKECISQDGEFSLQDWSWREDGSEYKIRCSLPARELFFLDFNPQ